MLNKTELSYRETGRFNKIVLDYIEGANELKPFYDHLPSIHSFTKVIEERKKFKTNRELLVRTLQSQYSKLNIYEKVNTNILKLKESNTYTVTTGHQLCLFTGPLYFIYKIVDTINLACKLNKQYPEYNFVPVYWMNSEDHDFDEINHINLFGNKIEWNLKSDGPVGRIKTDSLKGAIDELQKILGDSSEAKFLINLFEKGYLQQDNLSLATRYIVNELFGNYGLVILDPDIKDLKIEFASFMKDDIINKKNYELVNLTIDQLKAAGYHEQVKPREINIFYLEENLRARIVQEGNHYKVLDTEKKFTESELIKAIDKNPENFGPNVVTRPLYQELILPNIAYTGGGAEVAYWLEFKKMFEHHNIPYPVIFLRNSVMIVDEVTSQNIEKYKINYTELFLDVEVFIKSFIKKNSNNLLNLDREKVLLNQLFTDIAIKIGKVHKSLLGLIMAENKKQLHGIEHIEHKMMKAEKSRFEIEQNQIKKIYSKLFPNTILQERHDNFIQYYLMMGDSFLSSLIENLDGIDKKFIILSKQERGKAKQLNADDADNYDQYR